MGRILTKCRRGKKLKPLLKNFYFQTLHWEVTVRPDRTWMLARSCDLQVRTESLSGLWRHRSSCVVSFRDRFRAETTAVFHGNGSSLRPWGSLPANADSPEWKSWTPVGLCCQIPSKTSPVSRSSAGTDPGDWVILCDHDSWPGRRRIIAWKFSAAAELVVWLWMCRL